MEPVMQPAVSEPPAISSYEPPQQTPFDVRPVSANEWRSAPIQPKADLDEEHESMTPPPPLLDELDVPDEWPPVPANLLEDNLAPPIPERTEAPISAVV
jgi:hypothetical protein